MILGGRVLVELSLKRRKKVKLCEKYSQNYGILNN